jgi:DNA-binding FadR family transcriptional regulator
MPTREPSGVVINRDRTLSSQDVVSLKEYFESRINSLQEYLETRLTSIERATEAAKLTMEKRLEGMNEFRDALRDQAGRLATRDELSLQIDRLNVDISDLKKFKATLEGKASQQSVNIALMLSMSGLLIGVITLILKLTGG